MEGLGRSITPRAVRYGVIAALSFTLGTATIAAAGPSVSGLVGLIDAIGNEAKITVAGELTTSDATAATRLSSIDGKLATDSSGNLKVVTQGSGPITGTVSVSNFPATQAVTGAVGDARVTQQLSFEQITIPGNGLWVSSFQSTAGYSQLRVHVFSNAGCGDPLSFALLSPAFITNTVYVPQVLAQASLCGTDPDFDAVIDVPGTQVYFSARGLPNTIVTVVSWAR